MLRIGRVVLMGLFVGLPVAGAQGVLEFRALEHDFGMIVDTSVVQTTFEFENSGDQPVRLLAVRPSCGCTVPHFTSAAVAPGEKGVVEVAFDPVARTGKVQQSVVVIAENGTSDHVVETLVVRATVVRAER
jgi:hypothetical protein